MDFRIPLIVATVTLGLAADVQCGFAGQNTISAGVWGMLFLLLRGVDRDERRALMACLVIATAGEMLLSFVWGLYSYRLGNIPLYVPPGHALMLLLGISLARRMPEAAAQAIIACAAIYSLVAAAAGIDTLGVPLFLVLAAASLAMPSQRRLYASTFLLSLALEFYGTWLGNWTWAREVPGIALVTTNPPAAAGAFYSALDALVAASSLLVARRLGAHTTRLAKPGTDHVFSSR
jgi:hypothetical protein